MLICCHSFRGTKAEWPSRERPEPSLEESPHRSPVDRRWALRNGATDASAFSILDRTLNRSVAAVRAVFPWIAYKVHRRAGCAGRVEARPAQAGPTMM
jgi:hypothetical protein